MFSFNNISNGFGATENGQHNLKVSTYGMPVVKVEKSEPSCNTFKPYQTTALPPKSIFDVHSLRGLDTQDDVLKIQITNVQGATSDENIDKHQTPVNQKFNQVNSDQLMQSTFHVGTQEKYPMPERVPRRQLSKIIPEKKFALKTKMRSLQNQTNGKPPVQGEIGLQKAELPFQLNSEESEIGLVPSRLLRDQPDIRQMRPQFPTSAYQTNSAMPGDQVNTRVTFSSYQNGTPDSVPSPHVSTSMAAYEINSTMSAHQVNARGSLSPSKNGTPDRYKNGTPVSAPSPHVSTSMAAYEANSVMSAHEVDSRGTLSPYQNGTPEDSVSSPHDQISTSITPSSALMSSHVAVPLFHMEKSPTSQTDNSMKIPPPLVYLNSNATVPLYHLEEKPLSQSEDGEKNVSFKANYLAGMSKYFGEFYFQDFPQGMPFWPTEIRDMVPDPQRNSRGCNCCCHGQDPKNQRPSVIMVPASRSSRSISDSATSHLPLKVDTTSHKQYSEGHWPNSEGGPHQVHCLSDSDSSDDENGKEKYFRKNIDGTTARFKLTKEEWARIPINTFPSGGRLLSGDWTRIFLSKVKESNPWCSLRFKNNHVRSENSRKIHSAVFFRGGAECKRPECNVKVRFVIRKEKGKHVDVTYVGNVCHNSEPTVSDVISNRKRVVNRVRRTYST